MGLDETLGIKAIESLDPFPDVQLQYLKRILVRGGNAVEFNKLLTLHMKLLCKLHPDQVLEEAKRENNYPLDDALRLCEEYQVYDALAFFLEKAGNLVDALENLQKVEGIGRGVLTKG